MRGFLPVPRVRSTQDNLATVMELTVLGVKVMKLAGVVPCSAVAEHILARPSEHQYTRFQYNVNNRKQFRFGYFGNSLCSNILDVAFSTDSRTGSRVSRA